MSYNELEQVKVGMSHNELVQEQEGDEHTRATSRHNVVTGSWDTAMQLHVLCEGLILNHNIRGLGCIRKKVGAMYILGLCYNISSPSLLMVILTIC